jgi:hypothetical protein
MQIEMVKVGGSAVLAGALNGKATLSRLVGATPAEPPEPEPVFLDFAGVSVATASFLRESVLAFRDLVRGRRSTFYPVIANPNEDVLDELTELMRARGDVLIACKRDDEGCVAETCLIGELDPKQRITFDLVRKRGETDAGELMRAHGESEGLKHSTAWNNRLAALAARGLLMEVSKGRAKRYRTLFEDA